MSEIKYEVPEGWKLVPVEITPGMANAIEVNRLFGPKAEFTYHAMLRAAPPPPANIGADSPSVREKALREAVANAVRPLLLSLKEVYGALEYRVKNETPHHDPEPHPDSLMGHARTAMRNAASLLVTPSEEGSDA